MSRPGGMPGVGPHGDFRSFYKCTPAVIPNVRGGAGENC